MMTCGKDPESRTFGILGSITDSRGQSGRGPNSPWHLASEFPEGVCADQVQR